MNNANIFFVAVLLTVHNRKEKTIKCLKNLYAQILDDKLVFDVFVTDDGCSDGTPQEIIRNFPKVKIIKGNGSLFWNRGMFVAWQVASSEKHYDYFLWLNDDTFLFENALSSFCSWAASHQNSVIVGAVTNHAHDRATYGGLKNEALISPNGTLQECETMNGNVVLIPYSVFSKVGNLDWRYRHAIGDLDYGYRARRAGFDLLLTPEYVGICENNPKLPAWARDDVPFIKRLKNLYSPLGYAEPIPFFYYEMTNFGLLRAIKHFITIHIRLLFPGLWK